MKLPAPAFAETASRRQALGGASGKCRYDMIAGSALTPLRESVSALPAPAYRQEGGASSRLARDRRMRHPHQKFETDPEMLKKQVVIETYRSRGPGGQRKNKTETAVRLKHLPSGITVVATEHRTQSQNLKQAFERLRMRLLRLNQPRKRRIPTSTPAKVHERRIEEKKLHSKVKRFRQRPLADSD